MISFSVCVRINCGEIMGDFKYSNNNKRYHTLDYFYKNKFGNKVCKISLNAGFTCPNRDGRVGTGGCTYCNNAAFHPNYSTPDKSVLQQIEEGMEFHKGRYRNANDYLAYFWDADEKEKTKTALLAGTAVAAGIAGAIIKKK